MREEGLWAATEPRREILAVDDAFVPANRNPLASQDPRVALLWQCGAAHYPALAARVPTSSRLRLAPFLDRMDLVSVWASVFFSGV